MHRSATCASANARRDRLVRPVAGLAGVALAVLCASVPARAQAQAQAPNGQLDGLLETLQLKAKLAPAPAFVTQSRPKQERDFIPVGTPHPARSTKIMTPAEVAAAEADLDATRERQQRRAGQKPAIVPLKPAKGAAKKTLP